MEASWHVASRAQMKRGKSAVGVLTATGPVGFKELGAKEWHKELLVFWLFNTCIRLQTFFDRRLLCFRMTLQEASVLLYCVKVRRIAHGNLAIAIGRDAGKVTRFIQRLQAKRLVIIDIDRRDRRLSIIRPTAKGRTLAEDLASVLGNSRKDLFASIPEIDAHRVGQVLRQLYQNAVPMGPVRQKTSRGLHKVQVPADLIVSISNGSREKLTENTQAAARH
jgi:DNA-binding MarR family transcriptional regulator